MCKLRYQQSPVRIYAKFLAEDPDSGRKQYFLSRQTTLDVTDLVKGSLRTTDVRIASIKGTIVKGHSFGKTEVQVFKIWLYWSLCLQIL